MRHDKNRQRRKFSFESLEARQLMAGDVFAAIVGGNLEIRESTLGQANGVEISEVTPGIFRVVGRNQGGSPTTINGQAFFQTPSALGADADLIVNLGGGNDSLNINNNLKSNGSRSLVPDELRINMGAGSDAVAIVNTDVRDELFADLGTQNDTFFMQFGRVGGFAAVTDFINNMVVNGGAGADNITVRNTFVRTDLTIDAGQGNDVDQVILSDLMVLDDLFVDTWGGDDTVELSNSRVMDVADIDLGEGSDSALVSSLVADELFANMGAGDRDELRVGNTTSRVTQLDGGLGEFDRFSQFGTNELGTLTTQGFDPFVNTNENPFET